VVNISYWGRPPSLRLDFIIGTLFDIGGVFAFVLAAGLPNALRISSAEGMPGVGVVPGFAAFFISAGLGIPGVGVVDLLALVAFADVIGLADRPGGIFAGSNFAGVTAFMFVFALGFDAEFARLSPPHAVASETAQTIKDRIRFFDILPLGRPF